MSREFFDQVDDEVRGFVGPALRDFSTYKSSRLIKIWYADPAVHFEAQTLSGKWSPLPGKCLELGLHIESNQPKRNQSILDDLLAGRPDWGKLLPGAEHGKAIGPMKSWRRLSEVVPVEELDEEFAGEVAERFSAYIVALHPLMGPIGKSAPRPETDRLLPRIERSQRLL